MTQEDIDKFKEEMDRRAGEGEMITIYSTDSKKKVNVRQGVIDVMKELHGLDLVAEIRGGLDNGRYDS